MKASKYIALASLSILAAATIGSTTVSAAVANDYDSKGSVTFRPSEDPTDPVDPENPDPNTPVDPVNPDGTDPEPGTKGPLSIDFASSFDFGTNQISSKDQTYYARAQKYAEDAADPTKTHADTANYVQVTDNRGNNAGWNLKVKQNKQFTATDANAKHQVLDGAAITLAAPAVATSAGATGVVTAPVATATITLDPTGAAESPVMAAAENAGQGTWVDAWGTVEEVDEPQAGGTTAKANVTKDVSLFVPGATVKDAVKYETTLTWILSDTPA